MLRSPSAGDAAKKGEGTLTRPLALAATGLVVSAWVYNTACGACPAEQRCSGSCVNLQSDSKHCGACGKMCLAAQVCVSGTCRCPTVNPTCVQPDAGPGGCGSGSFAVETLDATGQGKFLPLAAAVAPDGRIGVAYYALVGSAVCPPDAGTAARGDYEIRYVEPGKAPEVIARVQVPQYGISVAFDSQSRPAVAFLGGASIAGGSYFWCQSDLAVAFKRPAWTVDVAARTSGEASCGIPTSDQGEVVGLWPSIGFRGDDAVVAYRDIHAAQFPVQGGEHSDLELVEGSAGAWSRLCCAAGGNNVLGWGSMNSLVVANNEPAIAYAAQPGPPDMTPRGVWFTRRQTGACQGPQELRPGINTRVGPTLAFDPVAGYGVAYEDVAQATTYLIESSDGTSFGTPYPVHGSGTGGWYPSVVYAPDTHEPVIAYYVCSPRSGVAEPCPTNEDELRAAFRCGPGDWKTLTVDPAGGYLPRIVSANGAVAVAYRDLTTGQIKLARHQP